MVAKSKGGADHRHACLVCRRTFPSAGVLKRHERYSDLHKSSSERQDEMLHHRKMELRAAMHMQRGRIMELDAEIDGQALGRLSSQVLHDDMLSSQRTLMEMQLRQMLFEYGQAQEMIEDARCSRHSRRRKHQPIRATLPVEKRVGRLSLAAGVASWQGNKDVQEDRYIIDMDLKSSDGQVMAGFLVLDGHSGSLCVDYIIEHLTKNLQKCINSKPGLSSETLSQAVIEACVLTDDEFLQRARKDELNDGSTLILGIVFPEDSRPGPLGVRAPGSCRLLIANVGDSRAVLCRDIQPQGALEEPSMVAVRLSEDHKPIVPSEQKRIEARGGIVDLQGVWRVFTPGPTVFGGKHISRWG
ncbi:unnamed protein product, partial [Polarella glacialis]